MGSTCPICFDELDQKIKATPNACDHIFCLPCLEKWSKLGNYCPVDRIRYRKIINLDSEDVIQVQRKKRKKMRIVYDFSTKCEICLTDYSPDTLLLCDCCDLGFHCKCLKPPLKTVPAGLWFCPTCVSVEQKIRKKEGITKATEADFGYDYFRKLKDSKSPLKRAVSPAKDISKKYLDATSGATSTFQGVKVVNSDRSSDEETIINEESENQFETGPKIIYNRNEEKSSDEDTISCDETAEQIELFSQKQVTQGAVDISGVSAESDKGIVPYLFPTFKKSTLDRHSSIANVKDKMEENIQLKVSVFESIGDVEASQRKYLNINTFAGLLINLNVNFDHCSFCKDIISNTSQKLCKICRLKYFKNHSVTYKKHKKSETDSKIEFSNNFYELTKGSQRLRNKTNDSQVPSMSKLERRKNSLCRALNRLCYKNSKISTLSRCPIGINKH